MGNKNEVPGSRKIPKNISSIEFDGNYTVIGFNETFNPDGHSKPVDEVKKFRSNMARHADFERAMDKFKAHLILRALPFVEFKDKLGKEITKKWFDDHLYEDDVRFMDVVITKVQVTTKKDLTGFKLIGFTMTVDDQKTPLSCYPISTIKIDGGYNYPLLDIFKEQTETLLSEAYEYLLYKSANGQLRIAV